MERKKRQRTWNQIKLQISQEDGRLSSYRCNSWKYLLDHASSAVTVNLTPVLYNQYFDFARESGKTHAPHKYYFLLVSVVVAINMENPEQSQILHVSAIQKPTIHLAQNKIPSWYQSDKYLPISKLLKAWVRNNTYSLASPCHAPCSFLYATSIYIPISHSPCSFNKQKHKHHLLLSFLVYFIDIN